MSPLECNELQLRYGHVAFPEENIINQEYEDNEIHIEEQPVAKPSTVIISETEPIETVAKQQDTDKITTSSSLLPEILSIVKPTTYTNCDLIGELKNLCIKILLLQAIRDVPIYAKRIKELCGKNPGRKPKDPPTTHVVGTLSDLILGKHVPVKYDDLGNPIVNVQI